MKTKIVKAKKDQITLLTKISKEAFDTDIFVGSDEIGGPPGYDSLEWYYKMQESGNLYSFFKNEKLIGGAVLITDRNNPKILYVGRIFIDSKYHRQGYGLKLIDDIETAYPNIKYIRLETPIWNVRTNAFYKKCGFVEMFKNNESIFFEKKI